MYFAKGRTLPLTPSCLKIQSKVSFENHTNSSCIWKTAKPYQVKTNLLLIHPFPHNYINTIFGVRFCDD